MSIDEAHLSETLGGYAEGVVMTSADTDRMLDELHRRLRPSTPQPRWRLIAGVAAALLLIAAVAGAAWWLRKPPDPVPSTPRTTESLRGLWTFTNPMTRSLVVIRPDRTVREYVDAQALVRHLTGDPANVTVDGERIRVDFTDPQGRPCRADAAIVSWSDGYVEQGTQTLTGPGCADATQPASTLNRLSPESATRNLSAAAGQSGRPVTDPVQLDAVWVLSGSGLVLAVDERSGSPAYVMDDDGDLDSAPDAAGGVVVTTDGGLTLTGAGCGETSLQRPEVRGSGLDQSFTATVAADPCGLFGGRTVLTWVRVL